MPSMKPIRLRGEPVERAAVLPRRVKPSSTQRSTRVLRVRRMSWRSAKSTVSGCSASMLSSRSPWLRSGSRRSFETKGMVTSSRGRRGASP